MAGQAKNLICLSWERRIADRQQRKIPKRKLLLLLETILAEAQSTIAIAMSLASCRLLSSDGCDVTAPERLAHDIEAAEKRRIAEGLILFARMRGAKSGDRPTARARFASADRETARFVASARIPAAGAQQAREEPRAKEG
jgi:hypothetical protein